jgi:chemotaxis protein CheX
MSEPQILRLADSLDMTAASALVGELKALRGQPLQLDASGVRRLGGQCLQVLIAARDAWAADAKAFDVAEPSAEFTDACGLFGCADLAQSQPALD